MVPAVTLNNSQYKMNDLSVIIEADISKFWYIPEFVYKEIKIK